MCVYGVDVYMRAVCHSCTRICCHAHGLTSHAHGLTSHAHGLASHANHPQEEADRVRQTEFKRMIRDMKAAGASEKEIQGATLAFKNQEHTFQAQVRHPASRVSHLCVCVCLRASVDTAIFAWAFNDQQIIFHNYMH